MYKVIGSRKEKNRKQLSQKKKIAWLSWLYRLMVIAFLVTLFYMLFFSPQMAITSIEIYGLDKLTENSIKEFINSNMDEKRFQILKRNNLILFKKNRTEDLLLDNFKRIKNVRIEKVFPHGLKIFIEEKKLSMLLCGSNICYVLDNEGVSYPVNDFTQEELIQEDLITLNDLSNSQFDDKNPLEVDFRRFVLGLADIIQDEVGISLKEKYETPNRMSGDLRVETENSWKIYFNEKVGLEKSASILRAVLENKIEKERQKDLDYIDLRIDSKVFYKFKDGSQNIAVEIGDDAPEEKKKETKKKK